MLRLPAVPLINFDPYISVWMCADTLNETDSEHWCGQKLPVRGCAIIDGKRYRFLGAGDGEAMLQKELKVTPCTTGAVFAGGGIEVELCFTVPFLPDDLDRASTPICLISVKAKATDGTKHDVSFEISFSDRLCHRDEEKPEIAAYPMKFGETKIVQAGQIIQKILSHSGDSVTIDWGYMCAGTKDGEVEYDGEALKISSHLDLSENVEQIKLVFGYDDIASILYFGRPCKAWYARNGKTLISAMRETIDEFDALTAKCSKLDDRIIKEAFNIGGEDYVTIVSAAWRHVFAAHKLIDDGEGNMAFISKENNSNGCAGTVDVSYPSTPMFLKFCPELVSAMCRPVLKFAKTEVWSKYDFASHDVGRYPIVTGQVYGNDGTMDIGRKPGYQPPFYLMPALPLRYRVDRQMPVEESGNMLIMLYSAIHYGADISLAKDNLDTCRKWVAYLIEYGEDPGEQLCTDDFAGHLAHNINLSAKAMVGVACYGRLLNLLGLNGDEYIEKSKQMAKSWLERAHSEEGTYLTFDKQGWSMKYNLAWDKALGLNLLSDSFYEEETRSYLKRLNRYGLPLDNRATYTKSDWELWCAAMACDDEVRKQLIKPVALYLKETSSRVAFSDWYDTISGKHVQFKARSVQGGLFMPFLCINKNK